MITVEKMNEVIYQVCEANGLPEIASTIVVSWSEHMTTTMGRAWSNTRKIKFSLILFGVAPLEEQINTVAHETAHIVSDIKYRKRTHHAWQWKHTMRIAGYVPTRTHDIKIPKSLSYTYKCECQTFQLSKIRHNKVLRGVNYTCQKCGKLLVRA